MLNMNTKDFQSRKFDKTELIKTYKNGSCDYRVVCACPRCGGRGYVTFSHLDEARCWQCGTTGKVVETIHVSDTVRKELTPEEIEANWQKWYAKNTERHLAEGFKKLDFKVAEWCNTVWFNRDTYYRIIKETEKAYLIRNIQTLKESDDGFDQWVPKKAMIWEVE